MHGITGWLFHTAGHASKETRMFEFKLPDLGEGVHEGQVVNVLVSEGDDIAEYQPMMEVETDKAAVEIPSPKSGVVKKIHVEAGQTVKVGEVMLTIDDGGGGGGDAAPAKKEKPAEKPPEKAAETLPPKQEKKSAAPEPREPAPEREREAPIGAHLAAEGPVPAAPVVRKLARELGVDIHQVPATGPGGRVLREDVERFAKGERPAHTTGGDGVGVPAVAGIEVELPDFSQHGPIRREPVPQIRKTIARQMTRAWLNVPRVTHTDIADVTDLERNRKAFNQNLREGQSKLTMTAIVIKAVAVALRDFPMINASFDAAADEIIYKDFVNIGVAVDTPRGLVVPVLRDANRKSLPEIAGELQTIGNNARAAKFEIADLRGATFSVTNYGAVGGIFGTPMVNTPESAILGLGRARMQPMVHGDQIVPRLILPLSLSFDHRIVDGADGARFTTEIIRSLENPLRMISLG
jgi:pyruvate dehydrogenase E2 component (dihydrolipoamide acetyltransferase)